LGFLLDIGVSCSTPLSATSLVLWREKRSRICTNFGEARARSTTPRGPIVRYLTVQKENDAGFGLKPAIWNAQAEVISLMPNSPAQRTCASRRSTACDRPR